jgi:hypothetical protein
MNAQHESWISEYCNRNPLPKFTHFAGHWHADGVPILRTQSCGWTTGFAHPIPFDDVGLLVIGAYCALKKLCAGDFMMAHRYRRGKKYK